MKNLILSGLLLFGGIMISLRAHKTRGIILMITLLLIISATVFTNLYQINLPKFSPNIEEYANKDYKYIVLKEAELKLLPEDGVEIKNINEQIAIEKKSLDKKVIVAESKENPTAEDNKELKGLLKEKATLDANSIIIKAEYSRRFSSTEGIDSSDQTCKILLTKPPAPAFKKISGKYSTGVVGHIKFENLDGLVSESGVSTDGTEFTFTCPNNTKIVAYDYILSDGKNGDVKDDSVSIFGGIGPVYCSDGSRINDIKGKSKDKTISSRPKNLGLSKYDYLLPTGFDDKDPQVKDSINGSIMGVSSDTCGHVCNAMGSVCNTASFNGPDNKNGTCFFSSSVLNKTFTGTAIKDSRVYVKNEK